MMKSISIFNDVLGPVMRGPSSSHTAGCYHIGRLAGALLGEPPASAEFTFDPGGSFAKVYRQQGSDLGFAAGLLGWAITDARFPRVLDLAEAQGVRIRFTVAPLAGATHPNSVDIRLTSTHRRALRLVAQSIGGGAIILSQIQDWPVRMTGDAYEALVETTSQAVPLIIEALTRDGCALGPPTLQSNKHRVLVQVQRTEPLDASTMDEVRKRAAGREVWVAPPVFLVPRGRALFTSAAEMLALAQSRQVSLGRMALEYEAELLGLSVDEILAEMGRRFEVMRAAVERGLADDAPSPHLLHPAARQVMEAEATRRVALGGFATRAAARALAVMHVNAGGGIVCAAPTAGSAGVIPGVGVTLADEWKLDSTQLALGLFAASAIGVIVATRATFAAEVGGCQVEIGAAGAMASALVVEAAGGDARAAVDAAAIALQNSMGLICDPVQGRVEIPCHTRNAAAAASAFVCADLALGGYRNPIPFDETIDAVYAVGKMLPSELRCTARGGLALTPSALALSAPASD